jgi:hypothetical protein
MEEEDCCQSDALLVDVVQQGKADRQAIRSVECDPEKAWLDGYVAGWFRGYFRQPESILKEERTHEQSDQVLS